MEAAGKDFIRNIAATSFLEMGSVRTEGNQEYIFLAPPTGILETIGHQNTILARYGVHGLVAPATESSDGSIQFGMLTIVKTPEGEDVSRPRDHVAQFTTTRATLFPSKAYAHLIRDYNQGVQGGQLAFDATLFHLSHGMTAAQRREFTSNPQAFVASMRDRLSSQQ